MGNAERAGQIEIHTLKVGGELTDLELMCIRSWIRLNYKVYVHSYDDIYLPTGAKHYDANLLMPKAKIFRNKRNGSLAVFADVYRATMLTKIPALWLDTDIFLIRAFDFSCEKILACRNSFMKRSAETRGCRLRGRGPKRQHKQRVAQTDAR